MYCKICGAALAPGDVFCKNCGASNTPANPQPVTPQPPVQPQPAVAPMAEPTPVQGFSQPMPESVPQPMVNEVPFTEPVQPVFNQTPMYGNVQPQPSFTQPVQPQPMNNSPEKKDNGKLLMIIGIVVGFLAVAVIAYLIYSTLSAKDGDGNNNGGGTTVVTQNTYGVTFADHRFTIDSDIVAVANNNNLTLTSASWKAYVAFEDVSYSLINENISRQYLTKRGASVVNVKNATYKGLPCWHVDIIFNGSRQSYFLVQRVAGGIWHVNILANPTSVFPTATVIDEVFEIVSNAKMGTTSNIEEDVLVPTLNLEEEISNVDSSATTEPTA